MMLLHILSALVLLCSLLLWGGVSGTVLSLRKSDPAGNGLSQAYGDIMILVLWAMLVIGLLLAGHRGVMPGWVKLAAVMLVPASCAAALATVEIMKAGSFSDARWPAMVPIGVPPLVIAYALWAYLPALRAHIPPQLVSGVVWGGVLLLAAAPWPLVISLKHSAPQRRAQMQAAYEAQQAREAEIRSAENRTRFNRLTQDSPLHEWLEFVTSGNELRAEALAAIHRLPHLQTEAEAMIARGEDLPMMELPHLGLELTPRLCEVVNEFLRKDAASFRLQSSAPMPYGNVSYRLERHLLTLRWLAARKCDLASVLDAYETTVRSYPETAEAKYFLGQLAQVRRQAASGAAAAAAKPNES